MFWRYPANLQEKTHAEVWCSEFSAWVFSCKFAAFFQNTFYYELLGVAASSLCFLLYIIFKLPQDNFKKDLERLRGLLYGKWTLIQITKQAQIVIFSCKLKKRLILHCYLIMPVLLEHLPKNIRELYLILS